MLGADVSSMQEAVDKGARFFDTDGAEKSYRADTRAFAEIDALRVELGL